MIIQQQRRRPQRCLSVDWSFRTSLCASVISSSHVMCGKDGWAWLLKSCRRDTVIWRHTERHKGERDRVSQREDDWLMWSVRRYWSPGETPPQTPITPRWRECRLALMVWKQTGCGSNLGGGIKIRTAGAENRKQTVAGSTKFLASCFRCEKKKKSPRVSVQKALQTCHIQQWSSDRRNTTNTLYLCGLTVYYNTL